MRFEKCIIHFKKKINVSCWKQRGKEEFIMKKLSIKQTVATDLEYAEALRKILESDNFILSIPLYNPKQDNYKTKSFNCKLDGITTNLKSFKLTLVKCVVTYHRLSLSAELEKFEKKAQKDGAIITEEDEKTAENIREFLKDLDKNCKEYILQSDERLKIDNFTNSIACYLAGYALPAFWSRSEEILRVFKDLKNACEAESQKVRTIEKDAAKKEVSYFFYKYFNIGIENTEAPLFTRLKANSGLINDILARYYNGRKIDANGNATRNFSDKAAAIEILLATVEYKQKLATAETIQPNEVTTGTKKEV